MRKSKLSVLLIILLIGFFAACERNDDEPILPKTEISRLYVSFLDVKTDDLQDPYNNIAVFDPAHAGEFIKPFEYNSGVLEGAGIYFDPFAGKVFQGSLRDQSIKSFSVNSQGAVGTGSIFRDSTLLYQRDLVYDHSSKNLYVSDNLSESIYVYFQALNRNGNIRPNKKFKLTGQPWGMYLQGDTTRGDSLFIAMAGVSAEVQLLEHVSKIDSGNVAASKKIKIAGASDLRGIAYSDKLNTLFLSDFGSGKVYIIEHAREAFNTQGTVTPTRTIGGGQTQLETPIDISVDDREDKSLIYVIDRASKKLLRFKVSDDGNVVPDAVYSQFALTPVSIYIDAR